MRAGPDNGCTPTWRESTSGPSAAHRSTTSNVTASAFACDHERTDRYEAGRSSKGLVPTTGAGLLSAAVSGAVPSEPCLGQVHAEPVPALGQGRDRLRVDGL